KPGLTVGMPFTFPEIATWPIERAWSLGPATVPIAPIAAAGPIAVSFSAGPALRALGLINTDLAALVVGALEAVEHLVEVSGLDVDEGIHVLDEHAADHIALHAAHAAYIAQHLA